jgi:hypothetical protein
MPEMMRISTGTAPDAYLKWVAMALAVGWLVKDELTLQRLHANNAYTKRPKGRTRLKGQLELLAAICMYERFAVLHRLSIKIFSLGLGKLYVHGGIEPEYREPVRSFLQSLSLTARAEVSLRVLYWSAFELLLGK